MNGLEALELIRHPGNEKAVLGSQLALIFHRQNAHAIQWHMSASYVRFILRWLVVVLFVLTTLPGRAQDGYRYIGKFGENLIAAPLFISVDKVSHDVFVSCGTVIYRFSEQFGLLQRYGVPGGGAALGSFNIAVGIDVVDSFLYVADSSNNRVQKLSVQSGIAVNSWGNGTVSNPSPIVNPSMVKVLPNGNLGVFNDWRFKIIDPQGNVLKVFGTGNGTGPTQFSSWVVDFAIDSAGYYYFTDVNNGRIQKFSKDGDFVGLWATSGGQSMTPYGVHVNGNRLYATDHNAGSVLAFDLGGAFLYSIQCPEGMKNPTGVTFDSQGNMLVADLGNNVIRVFEPYWNDTTPPTSSATLTPALDANGWTRGTTMQVTATDDASGNGVKEIRYQINDGAVVVVPGASAAVPFNSDGVFTVKTWAVDAANNVETPHTTTVKVDSTSPVSVAKLDKRTFSVSATDAVSGVASILVSIDGGAETVYSGPITFDINEHTLAYRALDIAGNPEAPRTVTLGGIRISKLAATPSSVKGGADVVLAAVLNAPAPAGGVSLTITSNAASVTGTSVVIPEGELLALVSLKTVPVASDKSVVLSSSLGVSSASTTVIVLAEPMKLTVAPADIIGGANTLGTVTLLSAAPQGGTKVFLSSGSSLVSVPSSVTVKAGKTIAVFTVRTKTVSATNSVNITAKMGTAESIATLTLRTPELISLDIDPSEVGSGGTTIGTVHLSCPAPTGGVKVTLTSSTKNLVVPATVVVAQGEVGADFVVKALPVTSPSAATVTASMNGVVKQTDVNIVMPRLKSLAFLPAAATGGAQAKGTLSLNGIASAAVTVAITSSNPSLVPAQSVVMPKGSSVAPILLKTNGVGSSTTVTVTATAAGVSVTADLILLPQAVTSVKLDKSSVKGGSSVVGTITLAIAAVVDTTVRVSVSPSGVVTVPIAVVVPKGSKTATFTVLTNQTSVKRTVTVSAESDGVSKMAPLSVTP